MPFPQIGKQTEAEASRSFATEEIEAPGSYVLQVVRAYDSYAVNPQDKDDPGRKRYVQLRVESRDVRRTSRKNFSETTDDLNARRNEIGRYADVKVFLSRDGNSSALTGRLGLLCNIAGTSQAEFERALDEQGLLAKAYKGTEGGEDRYDMGMVADEVHVNASTLVGRMFGGMLEFRDSGDRTFADLNPWAHFALTEEFQVPFKGTTPPDQNAFEGEDKASAEAKERFEKSRADKDDASGGKRSKSSGRAPRAPRAEAALTADDGSDYEFSPDADLPF